jgi:hypothetical protein
MINNNVELLTHTITTYTPHHEPSLPSTSGPTTHYLAVSSSSSSSTNAVIIRHRHHRRHRRHHGVGCCLVPAATFILTLSSTADAPHQRWRPRRLASSSSPPCDPPPHRRRALSTRSIAHGAIMDRHAASTPSLPFQRGNVAPARAPRRDTGPLRQRRRHDRLNASVSSPARHREDDAVTTKPDRHGHLCHPLGLLECGVCGLWFCL